MSVTRRGSAVSSVSPPFQIVATLGPASMDQAVGLAEAGATTFRLNSSHMTADTLLRAVQTVRAALPGAPVVVDLQGAKMRLGELAPRELRDGDRTDFAIAPTAADRILLPHPELFQQLRAGETLSIDDGRLRFHVLSVDPQHIEARVVSGGTLRPRKGVNVVEHPVTLADLSPADVAAIETLQEEPGLSWALSFVADGSELDWVRRRLSDAPVIAKVERARALSNLDRIERAADGVWICRGDLGAQIGEAALARWVGEHAPRGRPCATLMAGQVFEHLTTHPEPTRSEVCHLYDLIRRGYTGIVLSDETAVGTDPVRAVHLVNRLVRELG